MTTRGFQCHLPGDNGNGSAALCFNGGSCVNTTAIESCACVHGWQHDYSLHVFFFHVFAHLCALGLTRAACPEPRARMHSFHDANCALPESVYLYNVIVNAVVNSACAVQVVWHMSTARHQVRLILHVALLNALLLFAVAASTYAQNGWFEAALVFALLQLCSFVVLAYVLSQIIIFPVFAMDRRWYLAVTWGVRGGAMLSLAAQGAVLIAQLATCRDEDPRVFNTAATAYLFQFPILMFFASLLLLLSVSQLERILSKAAVVNNVDSTITSKKSAALVKRIGRIKRFTRDFFVQLPPFFVWPVVHIVLGSAPWFWVQQLLSFSVLYPLMGAGFAVLVAKRDKEYAKATPDVGRRDLGSPTRDVTAPSWENSAFVSSHAAQSSQLHYDR